MKKINLKLKQPINRYILVGIAAIGLLLIMIFKVPNYVTHKNLTKLGYSEEAINAIVKQNISNYIIKNNIYSDYLNVEVTKDSFNKDYIDIYAVKQDVDEKSFEIYDALIKKGYEKKAVVNLFSKLKNYELTPLLVFDNLNDETIETYIADCLKHSTNNENKFVLDGNYIKYFENINEQDFNYQMLINQNNGIKKDATINLVEMDLRYAIQDLKMETEAYTHFKDMVNAMEKDEIQVYAVDAYRSFDEQKGIYDSYSKPDAQGVSRPGHSEFNTGLAVQVVNDESSTFKTTKSYKWLLDNAHKYGFIIRYPEGKEKITGKEAYSNILRYVGIEDAKKVHDLKLTYEEYYALYKQYANNKEKN